MVCVVPGIGKYEHKDPLSTQRSTFSSCVPPFPGNHRSSSGQLFEAAHTSSPLYNMVLTLRQAHHITCEPDTIAVSTPSDIEWVWTLNDDDSDEEEDNPKSWSCLAVLAPLKVLALRVLCAYLFYRSLPGVYTEFGGDR